MHRYASIVAPLLLAAAGLGATAQSDSAIAAALRAIPGATAHASLEQALPDVSRFYERREFRPAWTDATSLSAAGASVLDTLRQADADGLSAEEYLLTSLTTPIASATAAAQVDVLMSLVVARYAHDLGWGVTLPSEVDKDNTYDLRPYSAAEILDHVAGSPNPGAALAGYAPAGVAYGLLKEALSRLRSFRDHGGWSTVSPGPALRSGMRDPRVRELRTLLIERGDLPAGAPPSDLFDSDLVTALKQFQDRHGLAADGVYGPMVVSELNVPLATRIQQVRLGLERLRWLPTSTSGRRIGVNLADFKAYVFEGDQIIFETRTVVGKQYHETPMFDGLMTYVVINPYWNVPPSIARAEILPKIKADPGYLSRNHMELEGGSVRQLPGPWNSLGRFKFMFPNSHNVYLHDTPARALFGQADRAASHGCIRLEKPAELAALLLAPQGWTAERIAATVTSGAQTAVTLTTPVPVFISYITAFVGPDDLLHYRRDIYGRDRKLLAALAQRRQGSWEQ